MRTLTITARQLKGFAPSSVSQNRSRSLLSWPGSGPRLSGLINEQYQGVIPERRASRVLSGIHVTACASFDMDLIPGNR